MNSGPNPDYIEIDFANNTILVNAPLSKDERDELEFYQNMLIEHYELLELLDTTWMLSGNMKQRAACEAGAKNLLKKIRQLEIALPIGNHITAYEQHKRTRGLQSKARRFGKK